ncbi:MAG: MFS transporter [Chloroflexota bacterium]
MQNKNVQTQNVQAQGVTAAQADAPPTRKDWLALVMLGLALSIVIIDATIVNVTLPSIRKEFGASLRDIEWISALYALVYAALIITFGRLGDEVGRKRIFMVGVITFVVGSLLVGIASNIPLILVGRVVQGVGGAMISPATLSILSATFRGKSRGVAFGVWGAVAGASAALGPLLGGFLTTSLNWRWAFLVNLPIGIIVVIGAIVYVTESKGRARTGGFDFIGVLLVTLGLSTLVFGLIEGQGYGWWTPKEQFSVFGWNWPLDNLAVTPIMFLLAAIFLTAFVVYALAVKRRGGDPLFDFSLLKYRGFRFGLITVLIVALGEFGVLFVLSIYLQTVRGLSAFDTGLLLLPLAIATFFAAPTAGALSSRFGPKGVVSAGMLIEAVSIFLLGFVLSVDVSLMTLIPVLVLYGIGVGLAIAQLTNITLSDIPMQYAGVASGANNTVRQVGAAIGVAVLGAIFSAQIASTGKSELAASNAIPAPIKSAIETALDNGSATDTSQYSGDAANSPLGTAISGIVNDAITAGTRDAAFAAGFFVLMGALSSLLIPNPKKDREPEVETASNAAEAETPAHA